MQDGDEKVVFTGDTLFHGGMFKALDNAVSCYQMTIILCKAGKFLMLIQLYLRMWPIFRGLSRGDAYGTEQDAGFIAQ